MLFYLPRPEDGSEDAKKAWHEIKHFYKTGRTRAVVERNGRLFYLKNTDPTGVSFLWDPKLAEEATDLRECQRIRTLHRYGAPGLFKPSIFEVLAQLPPWSHDRDLVAAFKTECSTRPTSEWTDIECEALNAGFHIAYTTLYARKDRAVLLADGSTGYYLKKR